MEFGLYQHYKGKFYQVIDLAKHSETQEEMVVYQALYGELAIWVRPKTIFEENVVLPTGESVPRFTFIYSEEDEDEHEDELLTIFDNKAEMQAAIKRLESHDVDCEVYEEQLDPKPKHFKSDTLYKLFVHEEDFEQAIDVLKA